MSTTHIELELARLRRAYRNRLYIELSYLVNRARELAPGPSLAWKLTEIQERLHKLAGSGGSFGFHQLSEKTRHLELILNNWLRDLSQADSAALDLFSAEIGNLSAIVAADDHPDAGPEEQPSLAAPTAAPAIELPVVPLQPLADTPRTQVCLVDTDPDRTRTLTDLLEGFGHRLIRHRDLASALRDCAQRPPPLDLFLVDIDGTGLATEPPDADDGIEALRALDCPVIALSTHDNFATRMAAARMGAAGFVVFPSESSRVIDTLERVLNPGRITPYRVLIVDDDIELANLYRLHLTQAGMVAAVLHQPRDVAESIARFQPELILLDLQMPECSGSDLATIIRQYDEWVSLPIVYLSAEVDFDKQIAAQNRGADDFLIKPLPAQQLVAAVMARVKRFRQLADLMDQDSLTSLLKHSKIKEQVQIELARSKRNQGVLSVVMLDIDHFKLVNDTYGHATGDRVLKALAQMLRRRLRVSDRLGRYGGEEFLLVLPNTALHDAQALLEQLRIQFAALEFGYHGVTFSCTFSAGIASGPGDATATSAEELVQTADKALYTAKNAGRNRIMITAEMPTG